VVLAVLTHIPLDRYISEEQKQWLQFLDKPEHFVAYLVLTTLLGCSLAATYPRRPHLAWLAVPIALAYGAVDEWTQAWVNRTCSLHDWYANAVGTLAAIVPILIFRRFLAARTSNQ
jgi:VanZ family protein